MTCDIKLGLDKKGNGVYCKNEAEFYGRWIAYCKPHEKVGKQLDWNKTYSNEIEGQDEINDDGQLGDMMLENL